MSHDREKDLKTAERICNISLFAIFVGIAMVMMAGNMTTLLVGAAVLEVGTFGCVLFGCAAERLQPVKADWEEDYGVEKLEYSFVEYLHDNSTDYVEFIQILDKSDYPEMLFDTVYANYRDSAGVYEIQSKKQIRKFIRQERGRLYERNETA